MAKALYLYGLMVMEDHRMTVQRMGTPLVSTPYQWVQWESLEWPPITMKSAPPKWSQRM